MLRKTSQSPIYYDEQNAVPGLYPMGKPMVSFGDYDADGDLDVISHPSNFIQTPLMQPIYWENIGNTYNPTALPFTTQFNRFSVDGDFNSDGYADSILIDTGLEGNNRDPDFFFGSNINYVKGSENGPVNASSEITGTPNRNGVGSFNHIGDSGDVDGDGDLDLVVAAFDHLDIYLNNGLGQFSYASEQLVSPEARPDTTTFSLSNLAYSYSGVGFLENNGNSTIVAGNYVHQDGEIESINNIDIYQKNTQGVYEIVQQLEKPFVSGYGKYYGVADIHGSDVNGDGREDFLVSLETEVGDLNNLIVGVYLQNENGSFDIAPEKTIELIDDGQKEVGIRLYDFNKDGYDDFSVSAYGFKNVNQSVWLNDRQGNFSPVDDDLLYIPGLEDWQEPSIHWADIDRDGSAEVIWQEKIYRDHPTPGGNYGEYLMVYEDDTMFTRDRLYLEDRSVAFDIDGNAGQAYRLYSAAFDRTPDAEGLGYWINMLDTGKLNLLGTANSFLESAEFKNTYGSNPTNEEYITALYNNVLGRDPDAEGFAWWLNDLENTPGFTKAHLLYHFSESAENKQKTADQVANGIEFAVWNNEFTVDDGVANISYSENLGSLASVVTATLGVETLRDANIVSIGLDLYEQGWTDKMVAGAALDYIGDYTVEDTVDTLYENLVGVTPTPSQAQVYVDMANSMGRDEFAVWASEFSEEFTPLHIPTLQNFGLDIV
jgi:hypothetical protein